MGVERAPINKPPLHTWYCAALSSAAALSSSRPLTSASFSALTPSSASPWGCGVEREG